jgi:hypothetical protein
LAKGTRFEPECGAAAQPACGGEHLFSHGKEALKWRVTTIETTSAQLANGMNAMKVAETTGVTRTITTAIEV